MNPTSRPLTADDAILRFEALQSLSIDYQLEECPMWDPAKLPRQDAKGNCSIAAMWALGCRILQGTSTWYNTAGIIRDAKQPGGLFVTIARAIRGCLVVFEKRPGDKAGHVAMVTKVGANGRHTEVIDCSPRNGRTNSVGRNPGQVFHDRKDSIYVWFTGVASVADDKPAPAPRRVYSPPAASVARLGRIVKLAQDSAPITPGLKGLEFMCSLPGALYFQSDCDLDTDGKRIAGIEYDRTHQDRVSMNRNIDSNVVRFYVLPKLFAQRYGISIGDVAAMIYRDILIYAVFADTGPADKIGEASIAVHRAFGFERIKNGRIVDVGIPSGVITIVFPRSGDGGTEQTPAAIAAIGAARFKALGGNP